MARKDSDFVDPTAAELGRRLRALRAGRGWTQIDLADESGLTRRQLIYVENGRSVPSLVTVLRLARALEVPPGQLVDGLPLAGA